MFLCIFLTVSANLFFPYSPTPPNLLETCTELKNEILLYRNLATLLLIFLNIEKRNTKLFKPYAWLVLVVGYPGVRLWSGLHRFKILGHHPTVILLNSY